MFKELPSNQETKKITGKNQELLKFLNQPNDAGTIRKRTLEETKQRTIIAQQIKEARKTKREKINLQISNEKIIVEYNNLANKYVELEKIRSRIFELQKQIQFLIPPKNLAGKVLSFLKKDDLEKIQNLQEELNFYLNKYVEIDKISQYLNYNKEIREQMSSEFMKNKERLENLNSIDSKEILDNYYQEKLEEYQEEQQKKHDIKELYQIGVPQGGYKIDLEKEVGKGAEKIVYSLNSKSVLLGSFRWLNDPNKFMEEYAEEMKKVRNQQEKNGAEYPLHIPYSNLDEKSIFYVAIENFGKTLKEQLDKNPGIINKITIKHIAKFLLNLLNLSVIDQKGHFEFPLDNHTGNITFDEINGLRLIDIFYSTKYHTSNYSLYIIIDKFLPILKEKVNILLETNSKIRDLFYTRLDNLRENDIEKIKKFLASLL